MVKCKKRGTNILLLALLCASGAAGVTYEYTALPEPGETFTDSDFGIYFADELDLVRAIYFYVDPLGGDSRHILTETHFQALVDDQACALMGACLHDVEMSSGIGHGLLRALAAFAAMSQHPELEQATLFFDGWSWGGQFCYHFTQWLPERVIGFVTQKGGYHSTAPAGAASGVPGYLIIGELDLAYRIENLTSIFEAHRPLGARWILAMEPGVGHARVENRVLLDTYFREVLTRRLPSPIIPGEPVILRSIPEPASWLGNRDTHAVGAFSCYDGEIGMAAWCPERSVAEHWQAFVSDSTVTDTIPCNPMSCDDASRRPRPLLHCYPNPVVGKAAVTFVLPMQSELELCIEDVVGRRVRTLCSGSIAPGTHRVNWFGRDDRGRDLPSGIYFCRLLCGDRLEREALILLRP